MDGLLQPVEPVEVLIALAQLKAELAVLESRLRTVMAEVVRRAQAQKVELPGAPAPLRNVPALSTQTGAGVSHQDQTKA